ncbi:hypothetical protein RJ640_026880, partial [Escallonia rubra]
MANNHLLSSLFLVLSLAILVPSKASAVPAIFLLGDSMLDVGTNNFVNGSIARADFPRNGVDFPNSEPTGRFSNGYNVADFLAKLMGFNRSPEPYLSLPTPRPGFGDGSFQGVNFASGGSGLLNETGQIYVVVPMSEQVQQFRAVDNILTAVMGQESARKLVSQSLFVFSSGSNDIFAYFMRLANGLPVPTPAEFITSQITAYESYITELYNLGARKFGIISVGAIGCCPAQRALAINPDGGCLAIVNIFATTFNSELVTLLHNISSKLPGIKYSIGDMYTMTAHVIETPQDYNFTEVESACCGIGRYNAEEVCYIRSRLCQNRSDYLFWDQFHLTEAAAHLAADYLYHGNTTYATPVNFFQLVEDNHSTILLNT